MPVYEYRCHECGETFEVRQKFSDTPITVHEACGGEVERLISAPALQFKGSGWYVTDYARNGTARDETSKGSEGSESKPDAKPAKTETTAPASPASKSPGDSKKSPSDSK
jgi:putative FmdB family regulatory protein